MLLPLCFFSFFPRYIHGRLSLLSHFSSHLHCWCLCLLHSGRSTVETKLEMPVRSLLYSFFFFFFTNDPSIDIPSLPALLPSSPFLPCIPLCSSICSTNTPSIHFFDTSLARSFFPFLFSRLAVFMRLPRILLPRYSISQLALSYPVEYIRARTVIQCGRGVDGLIGIFKSCQPIYLSRILIGVLFEGVLGHVKRNKSRTR